MFKLSITEEINCHYNNYESLEDESSVHLLYLREWTLTSVMFTGSDPIQLPKRSDPIQLPGGHYIYSKRDWKGLEAISKRQLVHPTPVVVISHTVTSQCENFNKCSEIVRIIQLGHIGKRGARTGTDIVDIGYNFLIGGDGNVYEGRGWDVTSFHRIPESVLGISFIGDFDKHELTYGQIEAAKELLALGVKLKKLSPSYILIAHSQTTLTKSPGKNVMEVIRTWPHWSPTYRTV
jgi:N-acetylmuramoyl-L-alanine amidase